MRRIHPLPCYLIIFMALTACQDQGPLTVPTEPDMEEALPTPPAMRPPSLGVEGYPHVGELRTGFIYGPTGQPVEIVYEIHDGLAIWQGDIVIGKAGEIARTPSELSYSEPGPLRAVVIDDESKRWPGGVIPWENDDADPDIVAGAIEMVENQTPGVDLVEYNPALHTNYVTFRDASGCSAPIGMQENQQFINLKVDDGDTFCSVGNGAHEILHVLGLYHEHTRCDRDGFVEIDFDEIEEGREGNFFKAGADSETDDCSGAVDIGDYDPGSMMHYGQFAFAIGDNPTIIPKAGVDGSVMGQRSALGPTDVETIDDLYGDNNAAPNVPTEVGPLGPLDEGSLVSFDAGDATDPDDNDDILIFSWSFGDGTCSVASPPSSCSDPAPDHPYVDDGDYGYSVAVSDGFDATAVGGTLEIVNVAPTVDAGSDATVDEGSAFSQDGSFADPGADTWSATVDYGDGSGVQSLGLNGKMFGLQHTYVDNSVNSVSVVVTDDDDGVGSDDVEVTVNNVAPTVDAGPDAILESGETYEFVGSFSDPGVEDDPWSWVVDWGDGEETSGQTSDQSAAIEESHQVCVAGEYTVGLTVTDKDGDTGSDGLTLSVPYVAVEIDIMPDTELNPVNLKSGGNLPVVILGAVDLDVLEIAPASLTLGDGTDSDTPVGQKNNGAYEFYIEDVNRDGLPDLTAMFAKRDLADDGELTEATTELVLQGFLADACTNFQGVDAVAPRPS